RITGLAELVPPNQKRLRVADGRHVVMESFDLEWGWIIFLGRDHQENCGCFGQWQIEPSRTVGVAKAFLAATLVDRMRNILAPFRLRMESAAIAEHSQIAVGCGVESKAAKTVDCGRG